ncbi:MAG: aminotransferase class V-fold PLP-dependent enzyme [Deltaproteobacteria bacterium]|nr:aminotransferase class V-fold PLP-dependent enzyme [Deltaproteobacteria bacterium]MBI5810914.1 aminotransferase class V-fold PLP-dependent enzyme [Deltaproteobacteria bacterium]
MIYLDNAATSFPKPESVCRKVDIILREIGGNPGRASHRMAVHALRVIFDAREAVSRLIGAPDSSRIVFTKNATEAINIALKGLLKPDDHVITTVFEHNSIVKTIGRLEKDGVRVSRLKPDSRGFISPEDIEKAMRENTKMVCLAHASNVFGTLQPVEEIAAVCRRRGVLFMVDGAQTVGAFPMDVTAMGIDILAATGHKALLGPQGTGFLYLRESVEPVPLIDGGTGEEDTILDIPERLESGTMNMPGVGGLGAGVEFVLKEGVHRIRAHEEALTGEIITGLKAVKGVAIIGAPEASKRASLVAFNIEGVKARDAGIRYDSEFSIMLRCGTHCAPMAHMEAKTYPEGAIRVSPGYFNTQGDIAEFLRATSEIAKI